MAKSIEEESFLQRKEALVQEILRVIAGAEPPLTINQAVALLDRAKGQLLDSARFTLAPMKAA
jgi:hypothetical protein